MYQTIAILFVVLIAATITYIAFRPDKLHVERSINIKASPEKIFALINDFHQWDKWTPYNKDPAMKKTFSGNASGKGAVYAWEGDKTVGKGDITITESATPTRLTFELHMIEPFEGRNLVVFALKPVGDSTSVDWIMEGKQAYLAKVMGLFFNMDQMVGKDFEAGLANLKAIAE